MGAENGSRLLLKPSGCLIDAVGQLVCCGDFQNFPLGFLSRCENLCSKSADDHLLDAFLAILGGLRGKAREKNEKSESSLVFMLPSQRGPVLQGNGPELCRYGALLLCRVCSSQGGAVRGLRGRLYKKVCEQNSQLLNSLLNWIFISKSFERLLLLWWLMVVTHQDAEPGTPCHPLALGARGGRRALRVRHVARPRHQATAVALARETAAGGGQIFCCDYWMFFQSFQIVILFGSTLSNLIVVLKKTGSWLQKLWLGRTQGLGRGGQAPEGRAETSRQGAGKDRGSALEELCWHIGGHCYW